MVTSGRARRATVDHQELLQVLGSLWSGFSQTIATSGCQKSQLQMLIQLVGKETSEVWAGTGHFVSEKTPADQHCAFLAWTASRSL